MELVDVTLTALQRRNRAAFAPKTAALDLRPGESVVLRDERGCFFAGTVVGLEEAQERYLIKVGVRLPAEYAMLRLDRDHDRDHDGLDEGLNVCGPAMFDDMQGLLDLLGEAREARQARQAGREHRVGPTTMARLGAGPVVPQQRLC